MSFKTKKILLYLCKQKNMELHIIDTGNLKLDGGAMFGVVPKVMWSKKYPADENNLCNWAMRCLLVVNGERKILIDNGMGTKQDERFTRHYYLNGEGELHTSLRKAGYNAEDITDVLLTHLHFDHVGGSVEYDENRNLQLTFPNAKYWTSAAQWEWAIAPNRRERASFLKENILPIQESGRLFLIEKEGELFPDVEVRFFDGHTAGQVIPVIDFHGKKIVFMADFLPSTAHIPLPWVMAYDTRPLITMEEKKEFWAEAIAHDYTFFLEHDLYHECCTLKNTEKGPALDKVFSLQEFIQNATDKQ